MAAFAAALRPGTPHMIPDMDPLDGGTDARVLLLLEKPGPQAARTGFVGRDNPSPTSAAIRAFLDEAGLPRGETLLWNAAELREGLGHLPALLDLLPRLDAAILVGRHAALAEPLLPQHVRVIRSAHPSPQVRAAFPERWAAIPQAWAAARRPS